MRAEQAKARSNRAENRVYFFLRFLAVAVFPIAKSSSFFPSLIAATSHRGFAPRPAQMLPALSRYFGGTFLPFSELPRPLLDAISPPNLASWLCSSVLLRVSSFPTSSRNRKSRSTDIEPRFVLGISYLSRQRKHHTTFPVDQPKILGRMIRVAATGATMATCSTQLIRLKNDLC